MHQHREKEILIVNGGKKGGGTQQQRTKKKKAKRSSPASVVHVVAPARRRRARRKNPGTDVGGTALASGVGLLGGLLMQPIIHQATRIANRPVRAVVRTVLPALVSFGGGLLLNRYSPAAGKGLAAVGAGLAGLHGMSELANGGGQVSPGMAKAGYAQLGAPEDLIVENGQVYQLAPDGTARPLLPLSGETVPIVFEDGSQDTGFRLAGLAGGDDLVLDSQGRIVVVDGSSAMAGIEPNELSGPGDGIQLVEGIEQNELQGPGDGDEEGYVG